MARHRLVRPSAGLPGRGRRRWRLRVAVMLSVASTALALIAAPSAPAAEPVSSDPCVVTPVEAAPPPTSGQYAGVMLTDAQVGTASLIASVAKTMDMGPRGTRIGIAVAMMESSLFPGAVNGRYVGLFQQMIDPVTGLYSDYSRMDPAGATKMFFDQLKAVDPGYATDRRPDWEIGEAVQRAGMPDRFKVWQPLGQALTDALYQMARPYDFATGSTDPVPDPNCAATSGTFDPGNIISDAVFYNTKAMTVQQIQGFIDAQGAGCTGSACLKNLSVTMPAHPPNRYCSAVPGGRMDAAAVIAEVSVACGINPQVMLVSLQKESALLTRTDVTAGSYRAAFGWHCPDSGPGGSPACDPAYAGFTTQAYGMAQQWARYRVDPGKYHYRAGQTAYILWNVKQTGCGGADVTIKNQATASLYNYTPYQPNAASIAAYPGIGDKCSSYGNRNFFFLFTSFFGGTGGGAATGPMAPVSGVTVTIPQSPAVPAALVGKTITAPTPAVARGIAAGLGMLGVPYVWGGGTAGGPPDQGCDRGGGALNSCKGTVGFDCSGLTAYVLAQAGFRIPGNSSGQRAAGVPVPWPAARPGDIIGYPGHVAIYLGVIDGQQYLLEAPYPGQVVHIRTVYRSSGGAAVDSVLHRYWGPAA